MGNHKFMQSLDDKSFRRLEREAKRRGCLVVQELIRALILPEWLDKQKHEKKIAKMVAESKID
jgi:hypothetical protein